MTESEVSREARRLQDRDARRLIATNAAANPVSAPVSKVSTLSNLMPLKTDRFMSKYGVVMRCTNSILTCEGTFKVIV